MFHLLVSYNGWENTNGTLDISRVFEYTDDPIVEFFKPLGQLNIEKIKQYPVLLMSEGLDSFARVANITNLIIQGKNVNIEYSIDDSIEPISNLDLQKLSHHFSINKYEFSRTHWAIKNIDLFKQLYRHQILKNKPTVFSFNNKERDDKLISVMMPFNAGFNSVYEAIQNAGTSLNMECLRADNIWEDDVVMQDVVNLIIKSLIVICDCTGKNPNVFYEAGIAHSLGKSVILITQSIEDIPFDLRHLRFLKYLNNNEGHQQLSDNLQKRINTIAST